MMRLRGLLLGGCLLWSSLLASTPVSAQTVVFSAPADAPTGITIQVLTDDQDTTAETIAPNNGSWEFHVARVPGEWRSEPTFLINLPARTVGASGVDSDATTLDLSFSFKASQANERFEVPLALFKGVGLKDRQAVEAMRPFQQFEKILLAQALALHYIARLHDPHTSMARFSTKLWFETVFAAIAAQRPLRVSPGLTQTIGQVFDDDADSLSHLNGAMAQIRQRTWGDQRDLGSLLANNDCQSAKALVDFLTAYDAKFPDDASAVRIGDAKALIASMSLRLKGNGCPPSNPL